MSVSNVIKSIQDIMRKDAGIDGDAQRIGQTGTGAVGRIAIEDKSIGQNLVADSHVTVIRLSNMEPRYIWCCIANPWVQERIELGHEDTLVSGSTKQVELSTTPVRGLPIPIAPLEEQKRIVAKVDQLMVLCDQLEQQLTAAYGDAENLINATIKQFVA